MFALRKTGLLEKRAADDAAAIAAANDEANQQKLHELAKETADKKEDYDRRQAELQGNAMIVQDSNAFASGGKRKMEENEDERSESKFSDYTPERQRRSMRRMRKSKKSRKLRKSKRSRKSKKSRKIRK